MLSVVEAKDIDSVRTFVLERRLMQWRKVKIHSASSIEAVAWSTTLSTFSRARHRDAQQVHLD